MLHAVIEVAVMLLVSLVAVISVAGWAAALLDIVVFLGGTGYGIVYLKAQLCIKRENSNAKSPGSFLSNECTVVPNGWFWQLFPTFMPLLVDSVCCYFGTAHNHLLPGTLVSIRAYGSQVAFQAKARENMDRYNTSAYALYDLNRYVKFLM